MKFYIDEMILWLNNKEKRTLTFLNDKVNVITGNSKTGKTAVLEILDYCFCGNLDSVTISREHIGENVSWYGVRFYINDKRYTIARGAILENGGFSDEYYFSQTGEIPDLPNAKINGSELKQILEPEFLIDGNVPLSHGGRGIKRGTKLSFRYFLMFNTLSKDIVDNGKVFFDKLHIDRYKDVWSQVFDLAFNVLDFDVLENASKIATIEKEILGLEHKKIKAEKIEDDRKNKLQILIKKAKEARLMDEELSWEESEKSLNTILSTLDLEKMPSVSIEQEYERLLERKDRLELQIAKLTNFKKTYKKYKQSLKKEIELLQPIEYIQDKFTENTNGEYKAFLEQLSVEFVEIKKKMQTKRPFEYDVDKKIKELQDELRKLKQQIEKTPHVKYKNIPTAIKLITLGEIKAGYQNLSSDNSDISGIEKDIQDKEQKIEALEEKYPDIEETRRLKIQALNEAIQTYITIGKDALDEYGEYDAWFDYKKAVLSLRRKHKSVVANISSSSDHLFMHLCLFAGMHEMLLEQRYKFVPSFFNY